MATSEALWIQFLQKICAPPQGNISSAKHSSLQQQEHSIKFPLILSSSIFLFKAEFFSSRNRCISTSFWKYCNSFKKLKSIFVGVKHFSNDLLNQRLWILCSSSCSWRADGRKSPWFDLKILLIVEHGILQNSFLSCFHECFLYSSDVFQ